MAIFTLRSATPTARHLHLSASPPARHLHLSASPPARHLHLSASPPARHLHLSKWAMFSLAISLAVLSLMPGARCQDASLEFTQPEEQPTGHFVGGVSTYWNLANLVGKDDFPNLRYSILSDDNGSRNFLSIDATSGNISFSKRVDREAVCPLHTLCELNIRVAVSGPKNFFSTIPVKIHITDVNDNAPTFPVPGILEIHISEAASENLSQVLTPASDADSSPEFGVRSYALDPPSDQFEVVVSRNFVGTPHVSLVLRQKLDRELVEKYTLQLVAKDGGLPPRSATLTVRVIVDDVNDNDPRFSEKVYMANFSEEAGRGFLVSMVTATDIDVNNNGKVVYELNSVLSGSSGDIRDKIEVDNNTGAVTLKEPLVSGEYRFLVDARDLGNPPRSDQAVVSVTVLDTINNQPIVRLNPVQNNNLPFGWVSEGSGVSTVVAVLSVEDTDTGQNGSVTCESLEPNFHLQLLEAKRYKVIIARQLDRESNATYTVNAVCSDAGSPSLNATATFTLNVFDVNDNAPVFAQPTYVQTIAENNAKDSTVIAVTALDKDEGQNGAVEYKLRNEEDNFRIIAESGIIKANRRFDREERDKYTLLVLAVDRGEPSLTSTATVSIRISDVNDVQPIFSQEVYTFQMYENKEPGSIVGNVTVTDPDLGSGGSLTFTLKPVNESDDNPFVINPDGRIAGLANFDREEKDFYKFYVIAKDQGTPKLSSSAVVEVSILDINDIRPTFVFPSDQNFTAYVIVPVQQDMALLHVTVHDSDDHHNSYITYNIAESNASDMLRIGLFSGEVIPNRDLTTADVGTYFITINVTDQGVPSLWDSRTLYIVMQSDHIPDDGTNYNVLIVSCIVCFTVIVSGAVLVVICFVSRHDTRKSLPTMSLFAHTRPGRGLEDVVEGNKQRIKGSRNVKEGSPKREHVSYHQQPHHDHHHNYQIASDSTTTGQSPGQPSSSNCRVVTPDNTVLVICPSGQGRHVTDHKPQKHEDFLSTNSAETGTGDSGHGSDEDMSISVEHANTSVAIPEKVKPGETSILFKQQIPGASSDPPKHQPHLAQFPSKLTTPQTSNQTNSVRFNPQVRSIITHRQPSWDELQNNNNSSLTYLPPRFTTTSTHLAPNLRGRSNQPRSCLVPSSTVSQPHSRGRFPSQQHPHRQISFVSQSSFGDDDNSDDSDLNTTTSGSYSVISDDINRSRCFGRPPITDMYV